MDCEFYEVLSLLPPFLRAPFCCLPSETQAAATEIRLRVGCVPSVTVRGREIPLSHAQIFSEAEAERLFLFFCGGAVYAHRDEIAEGFLTVKTARVGVCGRAVTQGDRITALADISSFNLRIPRRHEGVSRPLLPFLFSERGLHSTLLFGPPLSGKTTLLRDLARQIAKSGKTVAAVDERRELFMLPEENLDVFAGYPRRQGIEQAIRAFSPDLLVFDELGKKEDVACLRLAMGTGTAVLTSAHAESFAALRRRVLLSPVTRGGFFSRFIGLKGGEAVGQIENVYGEDGETLESNGVADHYSGVYGARMEEGDGDGETGASAFRAVRFRAGGAGGDCVPSASAR